MTRQELQGLIDSWENMKLIVDEAVLQPQTLPLLMDITLNSCEPKSWRAAWLIEKINDKNPELVGPFIHQLVAALKRETSPGKKRHYLKLISLHEITEEDISFLFDYCLQQFTSVTEPVAVRVHALQVLYNISEKLPELKPELLSIILYENDKETTAGIKARNRKMGKILQKEIRTSGIQLT